MKNIDLAIKACNKLKLPLAVAGAGREEKELKSIAGPTIKFLGQVSDEELSWLYAHCRALLFLSEDEDFGIVPVEAMSFGKPVIALNSGGVKESIIENKTGIFIDKPTVNALSQAFLHFQTDDYWTKHKYASPCFKQAKKFSKERFQKEIREFVENKWRRLAKKELFTD